MSDLTIRVTQNETVPEVTVMYIDGDLKESCIHELSAHFDKIIAARYYFVIMELSSTRSLSPLVLGMLMECRKRLIDKKGTLVFAGMNIELKSQLNTLGVSKIFKMYFDLRSALMAYSWLYESKPDVIEIGFPPELRFVPPVRQLVRRISNQKGYSDRDAFRIETIVDEVCNNAIEHSVADNTPDVQVFMSIDREKIELNVVNVSDPDKVKMLKDFSKITTSKAGQIGTNEKRGRGLALIKMLANDVKINIAEAGTSVRVIKIREE